MSGSIRRVQVLVALFFKMVMIHALAGCSGQLPSYSSSKALSSKEGGTKGQRKGRLVRGPYLQMVNSRGATLRWRTDIPTDTRLEVGTSHGHYSLSVADPTLSTDHEIRIEGLKEDTRYYYRIGSSAAVLQHGKDNYFITAPPSTTNRKIGVAVFGDCGTNDWFNRSLSLWAYRRHVKDNPAELMLLLGDNAYEDGLDHEYQKQFFGPFSSTLLKNHALFPAPGNHEYANNPIRQKDHAIPYYSLFSVPQQAECGGVPSHSESFYSYNWGNIHFLSLDSYGEHDSGTTRLYDTLGAQVQWVKRDLEANKQQWTIVYWHHPPYTMGSHNSDREAELVKIRQNFLRVLERYGVDLVISGHSHNYERSYLLNGYYGDEASFDPVLHALSTSSRGQDEDEKTTPYIIAGNSSRRGTIYVVAGSSGASGRVQEGYPHNAMPFSQNTGGMFYFEVQGTRLDARFIRKNGTIGDRFTIVKDLVQPRNLVRNTTRSPVSTAD